MAFVTPQLFTSSSIPLQVAWEKPSVLVEEVRLKAICQLISVKRRKVRIFESKVWLDCAVSLENNFDVFFLLAGFPMGYAAAAPAYSPNMYPGANPTFQTGMCNRYVKAVT